MFEALKKYAVFSGRARRKEYWLWFLFMMIASGVVGGIAGAMFPPAAVETVYGAVPTINPMSSAISSVFSLAFFLPTFGVMVRRLHDTGKSGWYWLINLIPLVGSILFLIAMCKDSDPGDNKYGSNPKA